MLLIDIISEATGQQIAVDQSGEFIFLASKERVPTEVVDRARQTWAQSEHEARVEEINEQVRQMIAQHYPMCEEIKLLRTAPSEEFDIYNAHVEACRQWGREQKALLGL